MKFDAKDLNQFEEFIGVTKTNIELVNSKGETMVMELEPLDSRYFGKIIYVQERMPKPKLLNPKEAKANPNAARYESEEAMLSRLQESDYDVWGDMMELLKTWITQSYPEIKGASLNKLLSREGAIFIQEFMRLHNDVEEETGKEKALKDFVSEKREQLTPNENSSKTTE